MSIPYSGDPIPFDDKESGVRYFVRPNCGDTETAIISLYDTLPKEPNARKKFFSTVSKESSEFIDAYLDIILAGWESKTVKIPAFPKDGHPSRLMKRALKVSITNFSMAEKEIDAEDLKK